MKKAFISHKKKKKVPAVGKAPSLAGLIQV